MNPLQLYVLAGPNGAGKSTLSETFVPPGTDIFDGDKEIALLRHKYSMTDSGDLYDAANGIIFQTRKEYAIAAGNDFAFETNFRTKEVMEKVKQFENAGYETRLIFIGLPTIEDSLSRVQMRVKAGGHFVDADNVGKNFSGGMENLISFYDRFTSVDVFESSMEQDSPFKMNSLVTIKNGIITAQAENLPHWIMRLSNEIDNKHEQKIRSHIQKQSKQEKTEAKIEMVGWEWEDSANSRPDFPHARLRPTKKGTAEACSLFLFLHLRRRLICSFAIFVNWS